MEQLIAAKIHPQIIISGWRKAVDIARQVLTDATIDNKYYMYGLYHQLHVIRMTLLSPTFVFESGHETGYMYMF